ncbi:MULTISPECIES: DUF554 domain-containing protein [Streptococcus]|uniref:DUF554 domain-containing protein n=1 Tax=Streptococcus caledonicus TaxID=2614158 RepID=A0ABW0UDB9_9STRE|nr:DUF554 domain-containing protein [Streptococcus sp. S784/96/1]
MIGFGTISNVLLIIFGGFLGLFFKAHLKESLQKSLMQAMGVAVIFLSIAGVLTKMVTVEQEQLVAGQSTMMIVTLALGTIIGELLSLDSYIDRFGDYLKYKTGNDADGGFVDAFVMATCTVCIGAMAIVGSIQDGISADSSTLIAKGMLDMIIIAIMTVSLGKGAIFSALPVAIFQGSVTLLAFLTGGMLEQTALDYLSLVGNMLIFCVGVNLLFEMKIKVANMLPTIVLATFWGTFLG